MAASPRRPQLPIGLVCLFLLLTTLAAGIPRALAQTEDKPVGREYRLIFSGNQSISEDRLRQAAAEELAGLTRTEFPAAAADDAAFRMEQAYKQEGYAFATVSYRFLPPGDSEDAGLEFAVSEGGRVVVEAIEFSGNNAFGHQELLAFFEGEKSGFLGQGKLLLVEEDIRGALVDIRDLYLSEGYSQAQVADPVFLYSADRTRVTVQCVINEGIRRTIQAVDFQGDVEPEVIAELNSSPDFMPFRVQTKLMPSGYMDLLADLPQELLGKPYAPRSKLLLKSRVQEIYGNHGFPFAKITVEEKPGDNAALVRLDVVMLSGPRVRIAALAIHGNERTSEAFIRSRLKLQPGDLYSAAGRQASVKSLYQTGLFSRVEIGLGEGAGGERILEITVQEAMAREVFFQGGWGSYELLRVGAGYRNNSLWGTGRVFRFEAGGSGKSANLQANIIDPWFLGSDITVDLPIYFRRREEPSFTKEELGVSLFFFRDFDFWEKPGVTLGYLYQESNLVEIATTSLTEAPENSYTTASAKLQVTIDSRNDIFFPASGHKAFAALEIADPVLGSGISFYRFNLGLRKFFPLGQKNTLGLRFDTGFILPGRDQLTIPLGERFFNGGENTVRSFKESQIGPRDLMGEPMGGDAFNVFSIELRRRLTDNLAAALFFDYGNVSPNRTREEKGEPPFTHRSEVIDATFADYLKGFRPGLGCGLLYLLPVGPARLDFAWNPDRNQERGENEYVIHFSIGTAF